MKGFKLDINGSISIIKNDQLYKSSIQDVDKGNFLIDIPIGRNGYLPLQNEEEIECEYYAQDGNYFVFNAEVIDKVRDERFNFYKLSKPYNIEKIQRRNYVRVSMVEYAFYKVHDNDNKDWKKGMLLDLSGGGLRIKVKEHFNLGDKLNVNLFLEENEKMPIVGEIVRVEHKDNNYICGLNFIDITERMRDKIIQKVFNQMRKQRGLT